MLLQFNVRNFMSIKDEVVLTAFANAGKEHENNLINLGKEKVLPTLAIYGANAAGKSNVFKALTQAILLVRNSNNLQVNMPTGIEPFLMDQNSRNEKTKMDFMFVHNGKRFEYGFNADSNFIYEEYLYEYKSARPTMIFERFNINEYKFTVANKDLEQYKYRNTSNKLFMCTATAWNCEATRDAYLWFAEGIDTYTRSSIEGNGFLEYLDANRDDSHTKTFLLSMLKHAEINIQDYEFESKTLENINTVFPGIQHNGMPVEKVKQFKLETVHQVEQKDGTKESYKMDFRHESAGTMLLFSYR